MPSRVDGYLRFSHDMWWRSRWRSPLSSSVSVRPRPPAPRTRVRGSGRPRRRCDIQQEFKYYITFGLKQQGTTISGKAGYQIGSKVTVGNVSGSIKGNHFSARVFWTYSGGRGVGIYNGDIQPTGTIFQGTTWDRPAKNGVTENFNSSSQTLFYCSPLPGYAEVSRMAVRDFLYQDEFDRFTKGGYRPVWIDGWRTADGRNWFNVVFQARRRQNAVGRTPQPHRCAVPGRIR